MSAVLLPREALGDPPHCSSAQALARSGLAAVRSEGAVLRSIGLAWAAGAAGRSIPAIVAERLDGSNDDPGAIRALMKIVMRSTQLPAMTDIEAWGGALALRQTVASLLDLLAQEDSVLAQLPATRYAFAGRGLVKVPVRASPSPGLAATFRREGNPIRVGGLTLTALDLTPLSLGVLATTTNEMLESALPAELEAIARKAVVGDSAFTAAQVDQLAELIGAALEGHDRKQRDGRAARLPPESSAELVAQARAAAARALGRAGDLEASSS
jgi:hypothetical protein